MARKSAVWVVGAIVALLGTTGCQTPAERDAVVNSRIATLFDGLRGKTMAQFIAETGVVPQDYYSAQPGRVFVIDSPTCRVLLKTERIGTGSTADNWRIVDASHFGGCDRLAV